MPPAALQLTGNHAGQAQAGGAQTSSGQISSGQTSSAQAGETRSVTLAGNVNPLAQPAFEVGPLDPETPMQRMVLVLKAAPVRQAALDALVEEQQNPASPLYHHWLTPAEFGARFGAGADQLAAASKWIASQGFTIDNIPAGNRMILFSGNAGEVSDAFHVRMDRYQVGGAIYIANAQDPQIPASLGSAVAGVLSLHDFRRGAQAIASGPMRARPRPQYTAGGTHYMFPADFASIYDVNPLYAAGTNGAGASIAVAGRSNINLADVAAFRAAAGLPANQPSVVLDGADPGLVSGDQMESTMDVEWSGAVAPAAKVTLVAAPSSATTDGIDLASAYIVNHALAPVMVVSYSACEAQMGATELAFYNGLWEQAASEGISVVVASGDSGAAACQAGSDAEGAQAAVNGMCSSPYATCVGGTEFNEGSSPAQYWGASNPGNYGTALGYIPETVWNESALDGGTGLWASGGGVSTVYAQPAWQAQVEGAAETNGMRGVPDVALAAADHDGAVVIENGSFQIVHGTSAAAAEFAGLMALVVESQSDRAQGNANPQLYSLAANGLGGFHATLSGNNTVPGAEGFTAAGQTYNLATGLGSVDANVLVNDWDGNAKPDSGSAPSGSPAVCGMRLVRTRCAAPFPIGLWPR